MNQVVNRVLEWGLRAWAAIQALTAVAWLLGPFGPGNLGVNAVPGSLRDLLLPTIFQGLFTGPIIGANLADPETQSQIVDLAQKINVTPDGPFSGAYGDINVGWSVQFSILSTHQGWMWIALHLVPLLVMATLWWLLADVVAQSRRETVFTRSNALRLTIAGAVILTGAPILSMLKWHFYESVAESSQIADRISVPSYSLAHLPWTAMAAGLTLIVLGRVWTRGAVMETDLGGLV